MNARHDVVRAATAALLAMLCALQLFALVRAPALYSPASVRITLASGAALTLGQRELGAPLADPAHLEVRRDADGAWWIGNTSSARQVTFYRGDSATRTGSIKLAAGQQWQIGVGRFALSSANARETVFSGAGHMWRYDGATLLRDGQVLPACPGASPGARAAALWNRVAPHALTVARPLAFGGNLYCGNRLGIADVAPASAMLRRAPDALMIEAGAGAGQPLPLLLSDARGVRDVATGGHALAGIDAIGIGRTRLAVQADGARLTLAPARQVAMYHEPRVALPAAVQWDWRQRGMWQLPDGSVATLLAIVLALLAGTLVAQSLRHGHTPAGVASGASLLVAAGGVACLLLLRSGVPPGAGISAVLGWAALWCCLLAPGRLALATAAGVLLVAIGLLAQLELGLAAMESSMLRHFQKTTALLAIGFGAGTFVRLYLARRPVQLRQAGLEYGFAALAACALAALLLQVAFGDETGVFDVQPVEFAKLALTVLTAHCLAVGLGWHARTPDAAASMRWLRLGAPVLLFLALTALALVQVDDFSPLVLLGLWGAAMTLAWSLAASRPGWSAAVAASLVLAATAIALLRTADPAQLADVGFYTDRFMVWLEPARHPHTGQQLLLGARAIADGAWFGSDSLFGIASLGQTGSSALLVPAVQDDFAPSFFLNRHGLAAALVLWLLQALFVAGLLLTAARAHAASSATRDFRRAWLGRFRCFALCGGAAFVLGHFVLSWGTNLAIFPVMGQPMSFLSSGGSHLLFFICPLLMFGAISAQSLEESRDAGLCPT